MNWPLKRLDEIGSLSRGRSRHRPRDAAHLYGGPYPFVQTSDIKTAGLYLTDFEQTYSEAGLAQSRLWPRGTLCITIAANIAETAILDFEACFPDSIIGFTPDEQKADSRFIKYTFDAVLKSRYRAFTQGAAQDNLSQEKLLTLRLPIPALDVQLRISEILSNYDNLINQNSRRIALLEQSAWMLYREWFVRLRFPGYEHTRIVNGVPAGWEWSSLGSLCSYVRRGITPKYEDEGESLVINQKCVRDGRLAIELARRQSREFEPERQIQMGDVLINSTGEGTLGRVAQIKTEIDNCTVDSHVTMARARTEVPRNLFGMAVVELQPRFAAMGKGATNQTELSPQAISQANILLPSRPLGKQFELIVDPVYRQTTNLSDQNRRLKAARDLLLPKLISGELTV